MHREQLTDWVMNGVNVIILCMIAALYLLTGTGIGDDAVAALAENETVYRGNADGKVAIECAVSWDAAALPEMLDVLSEHHVKMTFFVSGQWAKENPKLLLRMVRSGHEVGTMGYYPGFDGDVAAMVQDVETSAMVIKDITGIAAEYYFSGLRSGNTAVRTAREAGITHVSCTTDLLSGRGDAVDIATRALEHIFDGSILLIQPTAEAVRALPTILTEIEHRGFAAVTVGEVLQ